MRAWTLAAWIKLRCNYRPADLRLTLPSPHKPANTPLNHPPRLHVARTLLVFGALDEALSVTSRKLWPDRGRPSPAASHPIVMSKSKSKC